VRRQEKRISLSKTFNECQRPTRMHGMQRKLDGGYYGVSCAGPSTSVAARCSASLRRMAS